MEKKKINIFEIYNKVHGSNLEKPELPKKSYCPISTKRKEPKIVNGKFSLTESLEGDDKTLSGDLKRHFLEIISTYKGFRGQMQRPSDIVEIAETLCGIVDAAKTLTLNEAGDWFDKVTIKRNMTELERLDKSFDKVAKDAKSLDERLHALYEDMGNILNRYYEISDIDPSVMNQRLAIKENKQDYSKFQKYIADKYRTKSLNGWKFTVQGHSGTFEWYSPGDSVIYATPFWDDKEELPIDVIEDDGESIMEKKHKFKWTGDFKQMEREYIKIISKYFKMLK